MGIKNLFIKSKPAKPAEPFKLSPRALPTSLTPLRDDIKPELRFPKVPEPKMPGLPKPEPLMQPKVTPKPLEVRKTGPGLPTISDIKHPEPHLFIKVDKYMSVRASVKKLGERLKDLTATLGRMENLKDEEVKKIEVLKGTMKKMSAIVTELEKTFKQAREDYE